MASSRQQNSSRRRSEHAPLRQPPRPPQKAIRAKTRGEVSGGDESPPKPSGAARDGNVTPERSSHTDLHTAAQAEHEVQGRFLLDVVIRQRAAVFELLSGENEALL